MKKVLIIILCVFTVLICIYASAEEAVKPRVLVALGDSYTAGEGIEPYYGQNAPMAEKCTDPDWLAHRSEKGWPGMLTIPGVEGTLAEHRGENFFIAAVSGAKTKHLFMLTDEEKAAGCTAGMQKKYNRDGISGTAELAPQLSIFDELDEKGLKADYVVMSIGGNDLDFKSIISMFAFSKAVSLPGETFVDKGVALLEQQYDAAGVRKAITRVYHDVSARAGEQATILVVGYPYPLLDEKGNFVFSRESAEILNEANRFFCMELINIVDECRSEGMEICYVGINEAFEGHGAYAKDPYINPITLPAGQQDLDSSAAVNSRSMHPNLKGAEAIARCVQYAIDMLENGSERYIFDYFAEDD